jgi:hypothetical protein
MLVMIGLGRTMLRMFRLGSTVLRMSIGRPAALRMVLGRCSVVRVIVWLGGLLRQGGQHRQRQNNIESGRDDPAQSDKLPRTISLS